MKFKNYEGGSRQSTRPLVLTTLFLLLVFFLAPLTVLGHQPHDAFRMVAFSPDFANDQTIFAATDFLTTTLGLYMMLKSDDGGVSWTAVRNFPGLAVTEIVFSPDFASDQTILVATYYGLVKTTDGGDTWQFIALPGVVYEGASGLAVVPSFPTNPTVFAAGVGGEIFKSIDGGTSWSNPYSPSTATARWSGKLADGRKHIANHHGKAEGSTPALTAIGLDEADEKEFRGAVAVSPNYAADGTVFVAIEGQGGLLSTDEGETWTAIPDLSGREILMFAVSPAFAADSTAYAASTEGLFVTTDGGQTWAGRNNGISDLDMSSIVSVPGGGEGDLVAAGATELYRSSNGGLNWTPIPKPPRSLSHQTSRSFRRLTLSPDYAQDQFAALSSFEGVWLSSDLAAGEWVYSETLPTTIVRSISVSPTYDQDETVFATSYGGGVVISNDGGQNWSRSEYGLLNPYPDPSALHPQFSSNPTLYTGIAGGLQFSIDGARTFGIFQPLGTPVFPRAVEISPAFATDGIVLMGVDNQGTGYPETVLFRGTPISTDGAFLSINGGINWIPTNLNGVPVVDFAFSPNFANDHTVFAVSTDTGLYKSVTNGLYWTAVGSGPTTCCLSRVELSDDYANDRTLYVSRPTGLGIFRGLYRSINDGTQWARTTFSGAVTILDFALSPNYSSDGTVFLASLEVGLLKSTDYGLFLQFTGLTDAYVSAIDLSPNFANDGTAFAATYNGFYKTTDGGTTWAPSGFDARYEEDRPSMVLDGQWVATLNPLNSAGRAVFSQTVGNQILFPFSGTSVTVIGRRTAQSGIMDVVLDGANRGAVDLYSPVSEAQSELIRLDGLPDGFHLLVLTVSSEKNPLSLERRVEIDAMDVQRD